MKKIWPRDTQVGVREHIVTTAMLNRIEPGGGLKKELKVRVYYLAVWRVTRGDDQEARGEQGRGQSADMRRYTRYVRRTGEKVEGRRWNDGELKMLDQITFHPVYIQKCA